MGALMLNRRRSLDPRWLVHHRNVVQGFMTVQVVISRQTVSLPTWDPETNEITTGGLDQLWTGPARVQANKDWRVRYVESALDPEYTHFVRVQIPLRPDNPVPHIQPLDIVRVQALDPASTWRIDADITTWQLRVRNSINSSNAWLRNLLCVADVSEWGT